MAQKYGGKYFLSGAIGVCSVLTLITPLTATHGGVIGMCINQTIQGMSQVSYISNCFGYKKQNVF